MMLCMTMMATAQPAGGFGGFQMPQVKLETSQEWKDVNYAGDDQAYHTCDIYLPKKEAASYPVVIHIYGSAWFSNNSKGMADLGTIVKALLDAVEAWGKAQGMDKLQGPMGVTDFDKEGMLVEDFELRGSMTAYYNPAYYPKHMEQLGFEKEVDWLQIRINIPKEVPARYVRVAQYAREQFGLKVKFAKRHEVQKGEYGPKIFKLLNEAYAPIFGFSAFSQKQAQMFLDKYVPLFKMDMVPLVENEQGELVGIAVTMPSLTEALQKSHGRLWPTGWYHLLKSLKWKHEDNTEMLLVAVRPDYQGLGVNALFFDKLIPIYNKYGIKWAETGPQLEDNVRELTQWKPLHPETVKRRRCWMRKI